MNAAGDELEEPEGVDADESGPIGIVVTRATGPRRRRPHLDPGASASEVAQSRRGLRPAAVGGADPEERFAAALTTQSRALARSPDPGVCGLLAQATITRMGRVPYSSNAVFVLELDATGEDGQPLHAVYKPARGERPLWDFPHRTLHFREVATYAVDQALGFGLVPATVLRDGPHGPGSVQLLVEAAQGAMSAGDQARLSQRILAMAALDVLVNNADRKSSHLLVTRGGALVGIDHGLSFLPYPRQRTVLLELGGALLPDDVAAAVMGLAGNARRRGRLRAQLARLLDAEEVAAFMGRLDELAADPVYPRLDPWDGRPFEWW